MIDFDGTVLSAAMDAFGVPVQFVPGNGPPVTLTGVFERFFKDITVREDGAEIATLRPVVGVRLSQLPRVPAEHEQFVIAGQTWSVTGAPRDDGHGHITCFLHGPV